MKGTTVPDRMRIEGYAAVFDRPDLTGDVIRRGAFRKSIEKWRKLIPSGHSCVMMLYQHTAERPIGRWLALEEDRNGLHVRGEIFTGTSDGRDLYHLVTGRALDGLSIGFRPVRARRSRDGRRELIDIDLWEISLVTFPMASAARLTRIDTGQRPRNLIHS